MANEHINNEVVETTEPTNKGGFITFVKKIIAHPVTKVAAGVGLGILGTKVVEYIFQKKDTPDEYDSVESNESYGDETID